MSLQAMIHVPGLLSLNYPFSGQSITSHVRLAGSILIDSSKLPVGTQYIIDQLPPTTNPALVLPSHALNGKDYMIGVVSYFVDGTLYREVDYTDDEVNAYQFNQDYLPVFFSGEELSPGEHTFSIQITGFSFDNPGIEIYDTLSIPFVYDQSAVSIYQYIQAISPQLFVGEVDWNIMMRALDYIMTLRSEGALKSDIDFLDSLYDIDAIPDTLLPYLGKTVGYDYFTGISGRNQSAVRQELRFLPDWQKSVGTLGSITSLLRALSLEVDLTPLYLDMVRNELVPGVNRYFAAEDSGLIRAGLRTRRYFTQFSHPNFVPSTVVTQFLIGNLKVMEIVWSTIKGEPVVTYYDPANGWLDANFPSPAPTNAQELMDSGVIERIDISSQRGGLTMFFSDLTGVNERIRIKTTYQIVRDTRPGRNHRLSEFFDVTVINRAPPNILLAEDFQRIVGIIQKSKPFRTKMREITFPLTMADIYHVNASSVSSTSSYGNLDILSGNNIRETGVNLRFPMREEVAYTNYNRLIDGFTFTWEDQCDRWENRFGIFHSLAIEPSLHTEATRHIIQTDGLSRRGYAVRVEDDSLERVETDTDRLRLLRRLGLEAKNFKGGQIRCIEKNDIEVYYHKFFLPPGPGDEHPGSPCPDPVSPVAPWISPYASPSVSPEIPDCFRMLHIAVVEMDSPAEITTVNQVVHHFRVLDAENPGQFVQVNVTFSGIQTVSVEWEGISGPTPVVMDTVPTSTVVPHAKSTLDYYLTLAHPLQPQIQIILRFTAFETDENIEYLYATEPQFNNMPFRAGGSPYTPFWYAFATVITDPWRFPVQWTATYDSVLTNFQDVSCCEVLGQLNAGSVLPLNTALDQSYRYGPGSIELVAIEDATGDIHDRLVWNGEYWVIAHQRSPLAWDMLSTGNSLDSWDPANTNPVTVQGSVGYPAAAGLPAGVQESSYTFKVCAKQVGERLRYEVSVVFEEHFSMGRLHRGEYSPFDRTDTFYDGHKAQDLLDLKHNKYHDALAMDDVYFRADEDQTTPQIHPSIRYTLTPPVPLDQLQWDQVGHIFDGIFAWNAVPAGAKYLHVNCFPRKTIFETADTFNIANVVATVPDL